MSRDEHLRLFIALSLPAEVQAAIAGAQDELRRAFPGRGIRWTRREQMHLTLKFLGNVDGTRVEGLVEAVRGVGRGAAPLRLRAEKIGFFPDLRRPRVIWAGVNTEHDELSRLQGSIESAVQEFTAERPEQNFSGHVTIGRIKEINRAASECLIKTAGAMAERLFGEWSADQIGIIRSELSSEGPRYTTIAGIPLGRV
jgi:2'-5' RNA ligase